MAHLSKSAHQFALIAAVLILLTSSFDIFLVIQAGGNYRFCQMLVPPLIALAMVKASRGRMLFSLGLLPLSIWLGLQICFIPATAFWGKSLGYCLWLLLNMGMIFSFVQLFSQDLSSLVRLLRWYVWSFALVALFGVLQFVLPVLGLSAPLVQQWWIPDALPRANGFSYEPSYFATYLLIGFVFVNYLRRARSSLLTPGTMLLLCGLTALAIVLSSSRMGILFLLTDVLLPQVKPWLSFIGDFGRLRLAPAKLRRLAPSLLLMLLLCSFAGGSLVALQNNPGLALLFLNGTGLSDTAAHSVVQRTSAFEDTLTVFAQHPLVGRSLGGVSSGIAELHGENVSSFEASKEFEGMSVFAEALAASGIVGIIPFIWFFVASIRKPLILARSAHPFFRPILVALVRSLVYAWAILQFNQNMLRPYLWVHLAILASVYSAARIMPLTSEHDPPHRILAPGMIQG